MLPADAPRALDEALQQLQSGGLVAFPTDTVYGLGAMAFDDRAVQGLYAAKGRTLEKAIPVLLADSASIEAVAEEVPPMALKLAARFWPGPVTIVIKKNVRVPEAVSAAATVGVRVPDHEFARRLLRAAGPLAVTSANASGGLSATTAQHVLAQLEGRVPLILDGGPTPGGIASTVVDCTGPELVVLRLGPVSLAELLAACK